LVGGPTNIVVTAVPATLDHEGAVIDVLVCNVIVAADLDVPVLNEPPKYASIVPSQLADVYCQYFGLVSAVSVVAVVEETFPISISVLVLVMGVPL